VASGGPAIRDRPQPGLQPGEQAYRIIPLPRTSPALDIGTMPDAVLAFARTGQDLLSTPGVYRTRFRDRAR